MNYVKAADRGRLAEKAAKHRHADIRIWTGAFAGQKPYGLFPLCYRIRYGASESMQVSGTLPAESRRGCLCVAHLHHKARSRSPSQRMPQNRAGGSFVGPGERAQPLAGDAPLCAPRKRRRLCGGSPERYCGQLLRRLPCIPVFDPSERNRRLRRYERRSAPSGRICKSADNRRCLPWRICVRFGIRRGYRFGCLTNARYNNLCAGSYPAAQCLSAKPNWARKFMHSVKKPLNGFLRMQRKNTRCAIRTTEAWPQSQDGAGLNMLP